AGSARYGKGQPDLFFCGAERGQSFRPVLLGRDGDHVRVRTGFHDSRGVIEHNRFVAQLVQRLVNGDVGAVQFYQQPWSVLAKDVDRALEHINFATPDINPDHVRLRANGVGHPRIEFLQLYGDPAGHPVRRLPRVGNLGATVFSPRPQVDPPVT